MHHIPYSSTALRILFWLLVANVLSTILHYVDNIIFFHHYPEPPWMNRSMIDAFWFVMTPLAIGGYMFIRNGRLHRGSLLLYAYSAASLIVLGHYLYAPFFSIAFRIHFFILLEAFLAIVLVIYVAYQQLTHYPIRKLP